MKGPAGHRRVVERGGAHSQATRLPVQAEAPCGPAVPRGHVSDGGRWEASSGGDGVRGEGGSCGLVLPPDPCHATPESTGPTTGGSKGPFPTVSRAVSWAGPDPVPPWRFPCAPARPLQCWPGGCSLSPWSDAGPWQAAVTPTCVLRKADGQW